MIRVGIVGVGYEIGIAQHHIAAYNRMPDAKITALYDNQAGRAEDYIARLGLGDTVACGSYGELLGMVDAVSICTPNATHVALAKQALESGKHVLCEKPLSPRPQDCASIVEQAKKSGLVNGIGLCYRGIPEYRFIKKLVSEGALGDIYYTRQSMGGGRFAGHGVKLEWRTREELSGPGASADFGSHMLDAADWVLREAYGPYAEVSAMQATPIQERARQDNGGLAPVTNDDIALFTARTEGGVLSGFTASRIGSGHTFEVWGSKGHVIFNETGPSDFSVLLCQKEDGASYTGQAQRVAVPKELCPAGENPPAERFPIAFYHQIRAFLNAVNTGGAMETDFARGHYIQRLIEAVDTSAKQGTPTRIDREGNVK